MEWWILFFFLVSMLYSMVGHGGASAYLAIMSLVDFSMNTIRPTALFLNLFVSLIAFVSFARAGHFRINTFLPFAITSVPMAWFGGSIQLPILPFKIILGLFLIIASARMMGFMKMHKVKDRVLNVPLALLIGAVLGFLSGLIGIGGGIILSPIIMLLGWADAKTTAATSALFIFMNSLAGLFGMFQYGLELHPTYPYLLVAVILGGGVGGYLGSVRFSGQQVQRILSVILLLASVKLLMQL